MANDRKRSSIRVRVSGRVQGVWYRAWTRDRARELGLEGWVRNRSDGTVEALFVGPPSAVEHMIASCHEGPRAARVDEVISEAVHETVAPGSGFETLPAE